MFYSEKNKLNKFNLKLTSELVTNAIQTKQFATIDSEKPETAREVVAEIIKALGDTKKKLKIIIEVLVSILENLEKELLDERGNFKEANPFKLQFKNIKSYITFTRFVSEKIAKLAVEISDDVEYADDENKDY